MNAVAIDLDALCETRKLWEDWRDDAARRFRMERSVLERQLPNWEHLLARFAEDRAPVYLRPDADVTTALRKLRADGVRVGVFTDIPESLARVALAHAGASRRVDELATGSAGLERLRERFGADTRVVRTRAELLGLR